MKKTSVNRRKKLPLLLGALLIISVAAYGTRAYFSDSSTVQGDIQLSLGNVDIKTSDTEWAYSSIAGTNVENQVIKENNGDLGETIIASNTSGNDAISYTNVRPGDSFTKTYTLENSGSLEATVNIESDFDFSILDNKSYSDGPFSIKVNDLKDTYTLKRNESKNFTVIITVDPDLVTNEFNKGNSSFVPNNKITVDYLEKAFTINAVQTNVK
ncbi:hypothetical protein [Carnobacterium pleistocenium]|uniref:hypothetical protein n=1 Tax=Carnobacterium pleistocenium TaxID=181073 RepID=UPI00054F9B14|nr:hypothetical protein [Carnobacterium pleistocenium]